MALLYQEEPIDFDTIEDLEKYNRKQKIKFMCSICGKEAISYRINIKLPLVCSSCKLKERFKNKDWSERNKKSEETKLQRYGDAHYTNPNKIQETLNSKTEEEKNDIKKKVRQTNLEKYGGHPAKRTEQKEKTRKTCLEKYGCNSPFQNKDVRQKFKDNFSRNHGVDNPFQLESIKNKIKKVCKEKYGVENPNQSLLIQNKTKETCLKRYGCSHPWSNHDIRLKCMQKYTFNGINFDSSWELYYYIYLKDNDIEFEYQPNVFFEFDGHKYFPDFKVGNDFIEIKGEQFFENEKMINPYDRTLDDLYEAKHQCMLKNGIKIFKKDDLVKAFDYVNQKYTSNFIPLFKNDLPFPYPNENLADKSDYGLIRHFHKSIYKANREKFKSPLEAWNDKNLIYEVALNRLKYVGSCKPSDILYGFNVTKKVPKVSVFNPKLATDIIRKYLSNAKEIFDPFSGFSGRLIGAFNNGIKYIGQDINDEHIKESLEIVNELKVQDATLKVQDILTDKQQEYDALFTCPPYGNKETWNNNDISKSCDEWIQICLQKYKCKKYVFVIDETAIFKENIVEEVTNKSHFNENKEYIIVIEK